jgi:hypothetical protein
MSHIIVHRIEDIAARRIGRIAQIDALPPQLDRHVGNHWQLNRVPFARGYTPHRVYGRRAFVPDEGADMGGGGGAAPQTIAPGPSAGCEESRSYVLLLRFIAADPLDTIRAISTPPLPWNAQITNLQIDSDIGSLAGSFNVVATDATHAGEAVADVPAGTAAFDMILAPDQAGFVPTNAQMIGQAFANLAATAERSQSSPVGSKLFTNGKRLTFVANSWANPSVALTVALYITIKQCETGPLFVAPVEFEPAPSQVGSVGGTTTPSATTEPTEESTSTITYEGGYGIAFPTP